MLLPSQLLSDELLPDELFSGQLLSDELLPDVLLLDKLLPDELLPDVLLSRSPPLTSSNDLLPDGPTTPFQWRRRGGAAFFLNYVVLTHST
jgi:hypothetical protein